MINELRFKDSTIGLTNLNSDTKKRKNSDTKGLCIFDRTRTRQNESRDI